MSIRRIIVTAGLLLAMTAVPASAVLPAVRCEAGKNSALGKYLSCMQKAEQRFLAGGQLDTVSLAEATLRCESKDLGSWTKLEDRAGAGICPSEGDRAALHDFLSACTSSVQETIAGAPLPADLDTCIQAVADCETSSTDCSMELAPCLDDMSTCEGDLDECHDVLDPIYDQWWNCYQHINSFAFETCLQDLAWCDIDTASCDNDLASCQTACVPTRRARSGQTVSYGSGDDGALELGAAAGFTDNGDGTITDGNTALMWEKKIATSAQGRSCSTETVACANPHDIANTYTWTTGSSFNGSVVSLFLHQLNDRCRDDGSVDCDSNSDCAGVGGPCGFAGYRDWRLPNIKELLSRADYGSVAGVDPAFAGLSCGPACTDLGAPACSCDKSSWSSTTFGAAPWQAWCESGGKPILCEKLTAISSQAYFWYRPARAVRGGF